MAVLVILESESGKEYCLQVRNLAARFVDFFRLCLKHGEGRNTCQRSPLQGHLDFRWLWGIVLGARAVALFLWNPDPARILVSKCMKF